MKQQTTAKAASDAHSAGDVTAAIDAIIAAHELRQEFLLPILHGIQNAIGFVPATAVPSIAAALNLSRAEVHGVISFYHHFRTAPPGRHVLKLCRAEACQAMGARAIEAHVRSRLGIGFNETSRDGAVTLEPVYCLGNCACAPSLMLDDQVHGRLSVEAVDRLIDGCEEPA